MRQRTAGAVVAGLCILLVILHFYWPPLWVLDTGEYEQTTVTVVDTNGTQQATVSVRVADTSTKRFVGLSKTDSLDPGSGMLFVHDTESTQSYVMREMSFPLDIVFIGSDNRISEIHHAPVDGGSYQGRAQYVLEVERGWANATGVDAGDRVQIPEHVR
jgi:uncharacterized membrane protein (UPF0127 family)